MYSFQPHFIGEETETLKERVTHPGSQSKRAVESEVGLGQLDSSVWVTIGAQ